MKRVGALELRGVDREAGEQRLSVDLALGTRGGSNVGVTCALGTP